MSDYESDEDDSLLGVGRGGRRGADSSTAASSINSLRVEWHPDEEDAREMSRIQAEIEEAEKFELTFEKADNSSRVESDADDDYASASANDDSGTSSTAVPPIRIFTTPVLSALEKKNDKPMEKEKSVMNDKSVEEARKMAPPPVTPRPLPLRRPRAIRLKEKDDAEKGEESPRLAAKTRNSSVLSDIKAAWSSPSAKRERAPLQENNE